MPGFGEHPGWRPFPDQSNSTVLEDALDGPLIDIMTPTGCVRLGLPDREGLANPIQFYDDLPSSLSPAEAAKIMGGNLKELLAV